MTLLTIQPFTMKDCTLQIEADDYARAVSSAQFVPSTKVDEVEWHGLTPDAEFTDSTPASTTWLLNLGYAQDWETEDSLSAYLLANAGLVKSAVFVPKKGTGATSFAADITIVPGPIGGDYKTVAVGTVSMSSTEPVPTPIP